MPPLQLPPHELNLSWKCERAREAERKRERDRDWEGPVMKERNKRAWESRQAFEKDVMARLAWGAHCWGRERRLPFAFNLVFQPTDNSFFLLFLSYTTHTRTHTNNTRTYSSHLSIFISSCNTRQPQVLSLWHVLYYSPLSISMTRG